MADERLRHFKIMRKRKIKKKSTSLRPGTRLIGRLVNDGTGFESYKYYKRLKVRLGYI